MAFTLLSFLLVCIFIHGGWGAVICTAMCSTTTAPECYSPPGKCVGPNCVFSMMPNNQPCGTNLCASTCQMGYCNSSWPVNCSLQSSYSPDCVVSSTCSPDVGSCDYSLAANSAACNDNNYCTTSDQCTNGICSGVPVVCQPLDECHLAGQCNLVTGLCSNLNQVDGTPCGSDKCTSTCQQGACSNISPVQCPAPPADGCHYSPCANGTCLGVTREADGTLCNDGLLCTTNDQCSAGQCAGAAVMCTQATQCQPGDCSSLTGLCVYSPAPDGTTCDDGNHCTTGDTCSGGDCAGQPAAHCAASTFMHSIVLWAISLTLVFVF